MILLARALVRLVSFLLLVILAVAGIVLALSLIHISEPTRPY